MQDITKKSALEFWGIDILKVKELIETATKLEDNQAFFTELTTISMLKTVIKDSLEELDAYETDVKGLINAKAKALYGADWQVIAGEKFKITRSKTGDMYLINGEPNKKFIKVKKSVDSKAVDEFITENDKLPAGIELNDQRGESLRITLK